MLSVMLIDDESMVLSGMEALLKAQGDVELSIVSFLDSIQALSALEHIRPDLVITDINMPELDGLSFIEQALTKNYAGRFLIISGYEKIEYFKRAISYRVVDYLVKPIDKQRLYQLLVQMDEEKRQAEQALLSQLVPLLTQSRPADGLSMPHGDMRKLFSHPYVGILVAQKQTDALPVEPARRIGKWIERAYGLPHRKYDILLCNFSQALSREEWIRIGNDAFYFAPKTMGISPIQTTKAFLDELGRDAGSPLLLLAAAHLAEQIVIPSPALRRSCMPGFMNFRFASMLIQATDAQALDGACDLLLSQRMDPSEMIYKGFLETVAIASVQFGLFPTHDALRGLYRQICAEVVNTQSLRAALKSLLKRYLHCVEEGADTSALYSEKVEQTLQYMKRHFDQDISLDMVASHVELSSSYLSALFHKEVGDTFLSYLHGLRMEAACNLLQNSPSVTMEAISEHVGYQSAGHFFKVFKARYGISPNRWRAERKR